MWFVARCQGNGPGVVEIIELDLRMASLKLPTASRVECARGAFFLAGALHAYLLPLFGAVRKLKGLWTRLVIQCHLNEEIAYLE